MPKSSFLGYCGGFAAALALAAALTGCAHTEQYAVVYDPASALQAENVDFSYVTESEASSSEPVASVAAPREPVYAVAAPATARLDVDAEEGGPARLAEWDMPNAIAAAYPDLSATELEHYMVGQHVSYHEPIPVP